MVFSFLHLLMEIMSYYWNQLKNTVGNMKVDLSNELLLSPEGKSFHLNVLNERVDVVFTY